MNNDITHLRKKIDLLDDEIASLLSIRFKICKQIGRIKKQNNTSKSSYVDHQREAQIFNRLLQTTDCKKEQHTIHRIFETIFSTSIELQTRDEA